METERFEMRAPRDWLAAIDEWRREQPVIPSRAAAIRYLVEYAINALTGGDKIPVRNRKPA